MVKYEDHCCGCATENYPCRGSSCPNRNVEVHYCDRCGEPLDYDEGHEDDDGFEYCGLCMDELYD